MEKSRSPRAGSDGSHILPHGRRTLGLAGGHRLGSRRGQSGRVVPRLHEGDRQDFRQSRSSGERHSPSFRDTTDVNTASPSRSDDHIAACGRDRSLPDHLPEQGSGLC